MQMKIKKRIISLFKNMDKEIEENKKSYFRIAYIEFILLLICLPLMVHLTLCINIKHFFTIPLCIMGLAIQVYLLLKYNRKELTKLENEINNFLKRILEKIKKWYLGDYGN